MKTNTFEPSERSLKFISYVNSLIDGGLVKNHTEIIKQLNWNKSTFSSVINKKLDVPSDIFRRFVNVYEFEQLETDLTSKPEKVDENKKSLYDLIQSNKELVATNLKLTSMLEKVMANPLTEYDRKEIDQVEHAMLQAIREVVIEMGVGKLWPSIDKGDLKLGKLTSGYMKTKKEVDTHSDSGK